MDNYEKIEWFNHWVEFPNNTTNRILLIGDSVTRDIRKIMNSFLNQSNYVVDLFASSFGVIDSRTINEIKLFFSEYSELKWEYIVFCMGAHHGYNVDCKEPSVQSDYVEYIDRIVKILLTKCNSIVCMGGSFENESIYEDSISHNMEIVRRNAILEEYCRKHKLKYINVFEESDIRCRDFYVDWVHFNIIFYERVSKNIIKHLLPDAVVYPRNTVSNLRELNRIIKEYKTIYIWGNGKHGQMLGKYINGIGACFEKYITSDNYNILDENVVYLNSIQKGKDTCMILVTPNDQSILKKVNEARFNYSYIDERIYIIINELDNVNMTTLMNSI